MAKKTNKEGINSTFIINGKEYQILDTKEAIKKLDVTENLNGDITDDEILDQIAIEPSLDGSEKRPKLLREFGVLISTNDIATPAGIANFSLSLESPQAKDLLAFLSKIDLAKSEDNRLVLFTEISTEKRNYALYVKPISWREVNGYLQVVYKPLFVFRVLQISEKQDTEEDPNESLFPRFIVTGYLIEKGNSVLELEDSGFDQTVIEGLLKAIEGFVAGSGHHGMPGDMDKADGYEGNPFVLPCKLNYETEKAYSIPEVFDFFEENTPKNVSRVSSQYIIEKFCTLINFLDNYHFATKPQVVEYFGYRDPERTNPLHKLFQQITEILTLEIEINTRVNTGLAEKLSRQQQEFIAREKIKQLQDYLVEIGTKPEVDEFTETIQSDFRSIYPESVIKLIEEEEKKSAEMMPASPEAAISKNYVNTLKKLPWRKVQNETLDIKHVKSVLDEYHYGLEEIKERILEYLAVLINLKNKTESKDDYTRINKEFLIDHNLFKEDGNHQDKFNNVPILTLVGPPGTGKTSLTKAIAEALGREFVKISLGGVHDESEIRGHRRTYVGAMPGKIIKGITKAGVSNPIILLDEIDKMASDFKGDPASAMLEVLDPEQNTKFQDHYLEHEYDLSKCIFIATANYFESIPAALIDRVEIIDLSAYTLTEKVNIAKKHLLPKVLEQAGLEANMLQIDDATLEYIIKHYTMEAGVRGLKRVLDKIARKIVLKALNDESLKEYKVEISELENLLGVIKFKDEEKEENDLPGIVTGLAYTSYGGSTLPIEVTTYEGKPEIKLTGSLKEVMQESAQIALTYVRANAEKFGIKDFDFESNTIHIHVPEGAVPKDGPSAGVTFTTAIISALSHRVVSSEIGMTGEITLRGKVLEIGGLKEKSFAAASKGLKRIFIPAGNVRNLKDVPLEIKKELTYIPVKNYEEIYSVIFENKEPKTTLTFSEN
ncbi:endopeptidase La [Mycoplasma seminis]|uniref:endopeptidase La n=1 Tax=Mycoplasma seminis TaxID=512749 RepID=A0ABY9HAU4_9MOLU|nr:endopeptidase La [Mycoplasma seminis]WLP85319.1 endopeptidase La [Mycoplasma seminis]